MRIVQRPGFIADDAGAIMTVGAFMAIFLVGILYVLAGVGESIVYQERLQDAADAAAFTAAGTHARGMNTIANTNASMAITMAALAGFNLAVRGADLCRIFEIIRYPEGFCQRLYEQHSGYRETARRELLPALRQATEAAAAVAEATPEIAADEVRWLVEERAGDTVRTALLVPQPMAVSAGGTSPLCALANLYTGRMALIGMGVDLAYRIFGESIVGGERVGRDLLHCGPVPGVDAFVTTPPERPVGTEAFQVRVIVVGDDRRLRGMMAGVNVPRRVIGRPSDGTRNWVAPSVRPPGTLVVAQAEYYSPWRWANLQSDTQSRTVEGESFRMDWRARLRPFRVPTGGTTDPIGMQFIHRDWVTNRVLPACGSPCADVLSQLIIANHALH